MPEARTLHIDAILTNLSVKYRNEANVRLPPPPTTQPPKRLIRLGGFFRFDGDWVWMGVGVGHFWDTFRFGPQCRDLVSGIRRDGRDPPAVHLDDHGPVLVTHHAGYPYGILAGAEQR